MTGLSKMCLKRRWNEISLELFAKRTIPSCRSALRMQCSRLRQNDLWWWACVRRPSLCDEEKNYRSKWRITRPEDRRSARRRLINSRRNINDTTKRNLAARKDEGLPHLEWAKAGRLQRLHSRWHSSQIVGYINTVTIRRQWLNRVARSLLAFMHESTTLAHSSRGLCSFLSGISLHSFCEMKQ